MTKEIHFYTTAKSALELVIDPNDTTISPYSQPFFDVSKVRPHGGTYHYRRGVTIEPTDWVIYGVASTEDVDLVNDVLRAEDVFKDSLEEFVNTGRIFWEHGYKLSGKAEPSTMIDIPIGIPYLVEIYDNKLWVWIILDKSHPQSKKIWEKVNSSDPRFRGQLGLSIGALPQGEPIIVKDKATGKRVKQSPPMRLYEISVTGQPINTYTWAEAVKSYLANQDGTMKKGVNMEEKDKNPMNDAENMENEQAAMGMEDSESAPEGASIAEQASKDESAEQENDQMEPVEGADPTKDSVEDSEGDESLESLVGALEGAAGGEEQTQQTSQGDAAMNLMLDKIEMLTAQVAEISEKLNTLHGDNTPGSSMEGQEASEAPVLTEETVKEVAKSLQITLDTQEFLMLSTKSISDKLDNLTESLKSLMERLERLEKLVDALEEEDKEKDDDENTKKGEENVTKSLGSQITNRVAVIGVNSSHPELSNSEQATNPASEDKIKALYKSLSANTELQQNFADLISAYKSIRGTPIQVVEKKRKVFEAAKDVFGLTESEFKSLVKMF